MTELAVLNREVISCARCPRLAAHRGAVASVKRRAYLDWTYWGRPVPGFGDPAARLLLIGLAPGAHGANRTGRVFTGDKSGDFLYSALFDLGLASQAESRSIDDGLELRDTYISAAVRCVPPDNKPSPGEIRSCLPYLERELALLSRTRAVVALGRIAFEAYLSILRGQGLNSPAANFRFAHGGEYFTRPGAPALIASYHPSQQNTSTGRLTKPMFRAVFERAVSRFEGPAGS